MRAFSALTLMLCAGLAPLAACGDKDADSGASAGDGGDGGGDGGDGGDPECSGTAPEVLSVTCENTGVQPHYETGEDTVTLTLWVETTDVDGDLHRWGLDLYFDEEPDGVVDTTNGLGRATSALEDPECEADAATIGLTIFLAGGDPDYDTEVEWGAVVIDANGYESDMAITTCWTPTETGEDGGAGGTDSGS